MPENETKKTLADTVSNLVSKLGFPIVVAGWLLYERYTMLADQAKQTAELTEAINRNSELIKGLMELVK